MGFVAKELEKVLDWMRLWLCRFGFVMRLGFPQVGIVNKTPIIMGHH